MCAKSWLRGRVAERSLDTLNFLSHSLSRRNNISISQHSPILVPEKSMGLLEDLRDLPAKIPIFLVHEMVSLGPISVKSALYESCFAAASISSPFFME